MIFSLSRSIPLYSPVDSKLSSSLRNSPAAFFGNLPEKKPSRMLDLCATSLLYFLYGTATFLAITFSKKSLALSIDIPFITSAVHRGLTWMHQHRGLRAEPSCL